MVPTTELTLLIVATKAPWPPVDGGRLVLWHTLQGLSGLGHRLLLAAPVDPARFDLGEVGRNLRPFCEPHLVPTAPRSVVRSLLRSATRPHPAGIVRHLHPQVTRRVAYLLAKEPVDVVVAEQLQAVPHVVPAVHRRPVPVVLRAHNVESILWRFSAARRRHPLRSAFLHEARRLASWEGRSLASVALTLTVSEADVGPLERLRGRGGGRIAYVPAPFPGALEPDPSPLAGAPSVAVLIAGGWLPARDATRHFMDRWWPETLRRMPDAHLHVFGLPANGSGRKGVTLHPPPRDSASAFPAGAVVALPFRHPTGVPVKCLEAWSRGLPIVASTETARALSATDGEHLLTADRPEEVALALGRLMAEPGLRERLVASGRELLARRHDPERVAQQLTDHYRSCVHALRA
jgi:polysaccharide biosynthesis protein PslH